MQVFLLTLRLPEVAGSGCLERVGDKYSLYIYLSHYLIGTLLLDVLLQTAAPQWIRDWLLPLAVIALSVPVSAGLCALRRRSGKKSV